MESSDLLGDAVERSPIALVRTEGEGHIVRYANPAFFELSGIDKEHALGQPLASLCPDSTHRAEELMDGVFRQGGVAREDDVELTDSAGGNARWSYVVWPAANAGAPVPGLMIQIIDTTARAQHTADIRDVDAELLKAGLERAERAEAAEQALREHREEILNLNQRLQRAMTETHHRIKNNLQMVAAMIDMRVLDGEESLSLNELKRLADTVKSLAVVHDLLTEQAKADGVADFISARTFLERLLNLINASVQGCRLTTELEDVQLTARQGTSLSMIVNELVNNALKHASSEVEVKLTVDESKVVVSVCDDGSGFPPEFDPRVSANTGLELVETLTRWDLGGETKYENHNGHGARAVVTFPVFAGTPTRVIHHRRRVGDRP